MPASSRRASASQCIDLPIAPAMDAYEQMLAPVFKGHEADITEENLQARIRGNLLMALSNKFGWLVLTTGNKSENSVGYSTLYGDSAGGFAVIKDVPKTLVYRLVDFRNGRDQDHPVPRSIVERPPSAELRPDQKDADSLPDYDTLDAILAAYVEEDAGRDQLALAGLPAEAVERVVALVDRAEYKRRQAPPGIKITPRAFGRDRRMPITNAYRARTRPEAGSRLRTGGRMPPGATLQALVSAASISACRKWPRLMRATPSSASRSIGGAPGPQQHVHRQAERDERLDRRLVGDADRIDAVRAGVAVGAGALERLLVVPPRRWTSMRALSTRSAAALTRGDPAPRGAPRARARGGGRDRCPRGSARRRPRPPGGVPARRRRARSRPPCRPSRAPRPPARRAPRPRASPRRASARRPRTRARSATPALVVATAGKPARSTRRAVPASHALGRIRGSPGACSARSAAALIRPARTRPPASATRSRRGSRR